MLNLQDDLDVAEKEVKSLCKDEGINLLINNAGNFTILLWRLKSDKKGS